MNKQKTLLVFILSFAFVLVAGTAFATMTFNTNTITSDVGLSLTPAANQPVTVDSQNDGSPAFSVNVAGQPSLYTLFEGGNMTWEIATSTESPVPIRICPHENCAWTFRTSGTLAGTDLLADTIFAPEFKGYGTAGNYTVANSGIIFKDGNGDETMRLWASDPSDSDNNYANLYLGYQAGLAQPSDNVDAGSYNNGIGYQALRSILTGTNNTALGTYSESQITDGSTNVGIGTNAGGSIIHGSNNIAIGFNTGGGGDWSNTISIGDYGADPTASNHAVIGNNAITDVYFGSETPSATVHAAGYIANGNSGLNQTINVRKSDNSGACTITVTGGLITATTCP